MKTSLQLVKFTRSEIILWRGKTAGSGEVTAVPPSPLPWAVSEAGLQWGLWSGATPLGLRCSLWWWKRQKHPLPLISEDQPLPSAAGLCPEKSRRFRQRASWAPLNDTWDLTQRHGSNWDHTDNNNYCVCVCARHVCAHRRMRTCARVLYIHHFIYFSWQPYEVNHTIPILQIRKVTQLSVVEWGLNPAVSLYK